MEQKNKGITLIALVITIIVLLILAGVSINAIIGEGGIIQKAQDAQTKMDKATQNDLDKIDELNAIIGQYSGENSEPTTSEVKVTEITLSQTTGKIVEGNKLTITATISPENATNKEVEWTSSSDTIATVSNTGEITGIKNGEVTITATAKDGSGVTATCTITVTINSSAYTWTQNKTIVTGTPKSGNGSTVTLTVGEDYDYSVTGVTSGYEGAWKVIGAGVSVAQGGVQGEEGKLLIMTASDIDTLQLSGISGYNNGLSSIQEICEQKCGTEARSVNENDINRVTGFDPTNQGDGKIFGQGAWWQYGNTVIYDATNGIQTGTNGLSETLAPDMYIHPTKGSLNQAGKIQETSTWYKYYPYSLTSSDSFSGDCKGINKNDLAYEFIFGKYENGVDHGKGNFYWLASKSVACDIGASTFGIRYIEKVGRVDSATLVDTGTGGGPVSNCGVRAIISL